MNDIYSEHDRRTGNISAYAILKDGEYVGRATFINGAACTCYFQIWGAPMVKGQARGGNYDRQSAAAEVASAKVEKIDTRPDAEAIRAQVAEVLNDPKREGWHWDQRLTDVGYIIARVV